jgi:hypothetical protein
MVRTPVLLGLLALGAPAAARAPAAELPVITNGRQLTRADDAPPAPAKAPLPVITNQPMAPKPAKAPQPRIVVPYTVGAIADDLGPVTYNAYYAGPYAGIGYGYPSWVGGYGYGYGWSGWGYGSIAYPAYDPWYGFAPWGVGRPPLIQVMDTGIRYNVGSLVSMPYPAPVYGSVLGTYYRR